MNPKGLRKYREKERESYTLQLLLFIEVINFWGAALWQAAHLCLFFRFILYLRPCMFIICVPRAFEGTMSFKNVICALKFSTHTHTHMYIPQKCDCSEKNWFTYLAKWWFIYIYILICESI